jgi:hypothetical protein
MADDLTPASVEEQLAALRERDTQHALMFKSIGNQLRDLEQAIHAQAETLPARINEALASETQVFQQKLELLRDEFAGQSTN